jgi:hypothetical protein
MVAWLLVAPLATGLLYLALRPLLSRLPIPRTEPTVNRPPDA